MRIFSFLIIFFFISCFTRPSGKKECERFKQQRVLLLIESMQPTISDSQKQVFLDGAKLWSVGIQKACSKENTRN
jgi:hypothetical protein